MKWLKGVPAGCVAMLTPGHAGHSGHIFQCVYLRGGSATVTHRLSFMISPPDRALNDVQCHGTEQAIREGPHSTQRCLIGCNYAASL